MPTKSKKEVSKPKNKTKPGMVKQMKKGIRNAELDGLPVVDAKKHMVLHITEQDVKGADVQHPESCAAAKACRREHHVQEVRVHLARVYVRKGKSWTRYMTPKGLRQEIITFDRGGKFAPGEYVLSKPNPTKKLGAKMSNSPKRRKHTRKRLAPHVVTDVRTGPA